MRTRCRWSAALVALALVVATTAFVNPALAAPPEETRLLALANQERAAAGVPALSLDEGVSAVALAWAQVMAAVAGISHNPNYGNQIVGWSQVAENVGMGPSVDMVHQALVSSPSHYANLVGAEFTVVGIAVVSAGATVYVVQNFVRPASAAVDAPAPAPARAPARAGTPAPRRPLTTAPPEAPASPPPDAPTPGPEPLPEPPPRSASPALAFVFDARRAFDRSVHR